MNYYYNLYDVLIEKSCEEGTYSVGNSNEVLPMVSDTFKNLPSFNSEKGFYVEYTFSEKSFLSDYYLVFELKNNLTYRDFSEGFRFFNIYNYKDESFVYLLYNGPDCQTVTWINDSSFAFKLNDFQLENGDYKFDLDSSFINPLSLVNFKSIVRSNDLNEELELNHQSSVENENTSGSEGSNENTSGSNENISVSGNDSPVINNYISYEIAEVPFESTSLKDLSVDSVLLLLILIVVCFKLMLSFVKEIF